jgi:hypothetical protein
MESSLRAGRNKAELYRSQAGLLIGQRVVMGAPNHAMPAFGQGREDCRKSCPAHIKWLLEYPLARRLRLLALPSLGNRGTRVFFQNEIALSRTFFLEEMGHENEPS